MNSSWDLHDFGIDWLLSLFFKRDLTFDATEILVGLFFFLGELKFFECYLGFCKFSF